MDERIWHGKFNSSMGNAQPYWHGQGGQGAKLLLYVVLAGE